MPTADLVTLAGPPEQVGAAYGRATADCLRRYTADFLASAERAVKWDMDNNVNRRMAYQRYFGSPAGQAAPKKA